MSDRDAHTEARLIDSWHSNAAAWTATVRQRQIDSRCITDPEILEAITQQAPRSVLDIGCGEGWLARALSAQGIEVTGVDVVPELIERANEAGGGRFLVGSFDDLAAGRLAVRAQLAVCNFSLLGNESVGRLLAALPSLLGAHGRLVIQTVHPFRVCTQAGPYRGGWREETWTAFSESYPVAAPWYFRTLGEWIELLQTSGLQLQQLREPIDPVTALPLSLLLLASVRTQGSRSSTRSR